MPKRMKRKQTKNEVENYLQINNLKIKKKKSPKILILSVPNSIYSNTYLDIFALAVAHDQYDL